MSDDFEFKQDFDDYKMKLLLIHSFFEVHRGHPKLSERVWALIE